MTLGGTALNNACPPGVLPKLVEEAVDEALSIGFEFCVHPSTGRLLSVLASGVAVGGLIGETGTGTGAGLAWMVSANPRARFVSVEKDGARAAAARRVFAQHPNDDYEPMIEWPPLFEGKPDAARIDWLSDPRFVATEITVADHMAVLVCRRRPPVR